VDSETKVAINHPVVHPFFIILSKNKLTGNDVYYGMRRIIIYFAFLLLILSGCGHGKRRLDVNVSKVNVPEVKIHRYDVDLFKVNMAHLQQGLESLKPHTGFSWILTLPILQNFLK